VNNIIPVLYSGSEYSDERGVLSYNNDFQIREFVRAYIIKNSGSAPMRGWHGHKFESKSFICLSGRVRIGAVEVDDWVNPSEDLHVYRQELIEGGMDSYFVPAGYANAILNLEINSRVLVFSSSSLDASLADDFRFPVGAWAL
jgi:dTDP-4-dehydrorhamnose 3,5-epimerase-like enzyme